MSYRVRRYRSYGGLSAREREIRQIQKRKQTQDIKKKLAHERAAERYRFAKQDLLVSARRSGNAGIVYYTDLKRRMDNYRKAVTRLDRYVPVRYFLIEEGKPTRLSRRKSIKPLLTRNYIISRRRGIRKRYKKKSFLDKMVEGTWDPRSVL